MHPSIELSGRFELADERRYIHVPFSVSAGVRQIHISLAYNDRIDSDPLLSGGNTLDVGVFDEGGIDAGGPGFRGWSGSELTEITIGADWATPPYRPGSLREGTWHLLLGPYKIGARGLDWQAKISFDQGFAPNLPERIRTGPPMRPNVPAALPGWYRGDLHCHSLFSDGDSWPDELLHAAAEAGLDFLAITDHNGAMFHISPSTPGLPLLISGVETTTYKGHWNAWGVNNWFDFREPDSTVTSAEMRRARESGAFVSINHPKPWGPPWEYEGAELAANAIEIWNGPWDRLNTVSLAHWEHQLMAGRRLIAVGGSDTHDIRPKLNSSPLPRPRLGQPTSWIRCEGDLTVASLLDGLRAGRIFVSASPGGPQLYFDAEVDRATVRVLGGAGSALQAISGGITVFASAVDSDDWSTEFRWPGGQPYVRTQLVDATGRVLAVSNPIWRD